MKAYSTDLREKIALLYEHNDDTLDEVAELFDLGRRTVARFVQKHRAGLSLKAAGAGNLENVKVLFDAGADINWRDKEGATALSTAQENET